MSNLLLITDMSRLSKIFDRLAEDRSFTIRVANNLEKGGEEIAAEKPDVVFVQTHLSGLSADILFMHLKKQLGRKRSRFVLLAAPGQISDDILKSYQGWLDTSQEDGPLLTAIQNLLATLLSKTKTTYIKDSSPGQPAAAPASAEPAAIAETAAMPDLSPVAVIAPVVIPEVDVLPVVAAAAPETSLEEQGITYSARPRLSVYSEFNSSFDNAVTMAPEPAALEKAAPALEHSWNSELIDTIETKSTRSKRSTFLLWLAPVVVAVVVVTFLQKNRSVSKPVTVIAPPAIPAQSPAKGADQTVPATAQLTEASKPPVPAKPELDSRMTDKAVITAISENRGPKASAPQSARLSALPDFIPRYGLDKQYGIANPGWERYKGQVTEFKVLREAQTIKAIQVIDRGGQGVPESFMKGVLRQVAKNPVFSVETSEKKEGYEIQRGRISDNIKVVNYRDEQGGKLRAFVMTWQ